MSGGTLCDQVVTDDDVDTPVLKLIAESHGSFSALMSDRFQCLTTINRVLSDGNFKVIACVSVSLMMRMYLLTYLYPV